MSSVICKTWAATGQCRFGNFCRFKHDARAAIPTGRAPQPPTPASRASQPLSFAAAVSSSSLSRPSSSSVPSSRPVVAAPSLVCSPSVSSEDSSLSLDSEIAALTMEEIKGESEALTEEIVVPLSAADVAPRKALGRVGRVIKLDTNFFSLSLSAANIYLYSVEFPQHLQASDQAAQRTFFYLFQSQLKALFSFFFFDGTTMIAMQDRGTLHLTLLNDGGESLSLSLVKLLATSDSTSVEVQSAVNKMFKSLLRRMKLINLSRAYYFADPKPLLGDISVYSGFTLAVGTFTSGFQLNVELAHRVVQKRNVREQMNDIEKTTLSRMTAAGASKEEVSKAVIKAVNNELKGSVVITTYSKRIYRIDLIDYSLSLDSIFPQKNGSISYRQYYRQRWNIDFAPGDRKGLIVHLPRKAVLGCDEPIHLIPELCLITGVNERLKSDARVMQALAAHTRMPASKRCQTSIQLVTKMLGTPEVREVLRSLPLSFTDVPTSVPARVLGPFVIQSQLGPLLNLDDKKSNFQFESRNFGFFPPAVTSSALSSSIKGEHKIKSWAYIFTLNEKTESWTKATVQLLMEAGKKHRVELPQPTIKAVAPSQDRKIPSKQDWALALSQVVAMKPSFIVFIISEQEDVYGLIKGETIERHGIVTQCLNIETLDNAKIYRAAIANVLVQILAKLGAQPWRADLSPYLPAAAQGDKAQPQSCKGMMMIGIDVQHEKHELSAYQAAPNAVRDRSTVGFVASFNPPYHSAFHSFVSFQEARTEVVKEAKELMKRALEAYKVCNRAFPASVYVYRDGVGDSQLANFVRQEIQDFEQAFRELSIKPKLTVIVVQKRISVRLFQPCPVFHKQATTCSNSKCNGQEAHHSPTPLTVVDQVISSALLSDFYLVPCAAPPGATSRPTRYIVVRDDLYQSADQMQQQALACCALYANWNGFIRVPAATMLAHKIAFLFGKYIAKGAIHPALLDKLFYL